MTETVSTYHFERNGVKSRNLNYMNVMQVKPVVIVPTYDNGKTVCQVIEGVGKYVSDIIVVDDGSRDGTAELLRGVTQEQTGAVRGSEASGDSCASRGTGDVRARIIVVTHEKNRGKGQALKSGFAKARELGFTHAVTLDADGQHYPSDLPAFLRLISEHPQAIIVGSRDLRADGMPSKNTFANQFSNFWFRLYTGIALPDTQTGFRAYPLSHLHGLRLLTSRYEAELELLIFAAWHNTPLVPLPIRVHYPPKSERVTHFRPVADFARITLLNTVLLFVSILYGRPSQVLRCLRSRHHSAE